MALITSTLTSNSNGYSIVNKNYLESFTRDYVRCAVADIVNPIEQTDYSISHNLGTQDIVLNAYDVSSTPHSVDIAYSVPDSSTVIVSFDSLGGSKSLIHIVIMGALTHSTATVTVINNQS